MMMLLDTVLSDLRLSARIMVRNAGTTTVTVLVLAIGIGVSTAVFTGYEAMVARPLDARNTEEMVNLALKRDTGAPQTAFSYPDYEAFRDSLSCFQGLVAFRPEQLVFSESGTSKQARAPITGSALGRMGMLQRDVGGAEFASVFVVSENYFEVLGTKLIEGRNFAPAADNPKVLISENYWKKHFNGERSVLGRTIHLNGVAFMIAGITPHDFVGTSVGAPAFWMPIYAEPLVHADPLWLTRQENQQYRLFGRLAPGVTMKQAQAQMSPLADHLRTLHEPHSEWSKPGRIIVWPGSPFPLPIKEYGGLALAVALTMCAGGMVLLVACANVGSLQLARARSRQNELRTRMSLGASRSRLVRQLLTESALVGVMAGGVALLLTWAILKVAVTMMANAIPGEYGGLVFDVTPNLGIFGFVFAISMAAGMLSGWAPAMESSSVRLVQATSGGTAPVRSRRLQNALVSTQVALSLILLIAGSMAIRSSMRAVEVNGGFESRQVLQIDVQFPDTLKYGAEQKRQLLEELRGRLAETVPAVAAVTSARPPYDPGLRTVALGKQDSGPARIHYSFVEPNFFETLSVRLKLGRSFSEQPGQTVVLSESAAKELWPDESPIGRMVRLGPTDGRNHDLNELSAMDRAAAFQVIGVANDTRAAEFGTPDSKRVYLPMPLDRRQYFPLLVRTRTDAEQIIGSVDALMTSIDPNLMGSCASLEHMQKQTAPFVAASLAALISTSIGVVGLLLAVMGIYGTVSYIVVLRTKEVGIRMAIGAQKRDVVGLVLSESARPILIGLFAGSLLAVGAAYLARGVLYGLNEIDAVSVAGVSLLFLVVGMAAAFAPALRAARVDPLVALRYE